MKSDPNDTAALNATSKLTSNVIVRLDKVAVPAKRMTISAATNVENQEVPPETPNASVDVTQIVATPKTEIIRKIVVALANGPMRES